MKNLTNKDKLDDLLINEIEKGLYLCLATPSFGDKEVFDSCFGSYLRAMFYNAKNQKSQSGKKLLKGKVSRPLVILTNSIKHKSGNSIVHFLASNTDFFKGLFSEAVRSQKPEEYLRTFSFYISSEKIQRPYVFGELGGAYLDCLRTENSNTFFDSYSAKSMYDEFISIIFKNRQTHQIKNRDIISQYRKNMH